ncbi:hypothetical protein [Alteromonas sp. ASW11-130]|uniref:hypothetical protein n=1 Tax=Alteromonas sp. ASW11-130 TaxID=3015775 RepID=UPI002242766F|nr:hypothetical protein [Alteromonas sp. ASW11-130]MCW8092442.1 hypothetical protein [Alteromonas sp. ASW11-130]
MLFCGLPGNPVCAFVTAHKLVIPAIRLLQHALTENNICVPMLKSKSLTGISCLTGRQEFMRGNLIVTKDARLRVIPQPKQSSAAIQALAKANCYIVVPAELRKISAGSEVDIEPF